ncbi:MAG: hypothetical protein EXQ56_01490 [Acidobacteria bacterium]|nr:hypothetical protein [Acidobacteriota bacterium]
MSVRAEYIDGIFRPLEKVADAAPGKKHRIFSEEELLSLTKHSGWLKATEKSFQFWNNEEDAVYDKL